MSKTKNTAIQQAVQSVVDALREIEQLGQSFDDAEIAIRTQLLPELERLNLLEHEQISTLSARKIAVEEYNYPDTSATSMRIRKAIVAGKIKATRDVAGWYINKQSLYDWLEDPEQHRRGRRWHKNDNNDFKE